MEGVAVVGGLGAGAGASVSTLAAFSVPAHRTQLVNFPHGAFVLEEYRRGMAATNSALRLVCCWCRDPVLRQAEDPSSTQRGKSAGPVEETKKLIEDWCLGHGGLEPHLRD